MVPGDVALRGSCAGATGGAGREALVLLQASRVGFRLARVLDDRGRFTSAAAASWCSLRWLLAAGRPPSLDTRVGEHLRVPPDAKSVRSG